MPPQPDGVSHVDQDQDCCCCLAALAVTGSIATTTQAEASPLGWGFIVGAGLVGVAIVGSAIAASSDGYYYDDYRCCGLARQYDAYGDFVGRVRTCYCDQLNVRLWIPRPARAPHPPRVVPPGRVTFLGDRARQRPCCKTVIRWLPSKRQVGSLLAIANYLQ